MLYRYQLIIFFMWCRFIIIIFSSIFHSPTFRIVILWFISMIYSLSIGFDLYLKILFQFLLIHSFFEFIYFVHTSLFFLDFFEIVKFKIWISFSWISKFVNLNWEIKNFNIFLNKVEKFYKYPFSEHIFSLEYTYCAFCLCFLGIWIVYFKLEGIKWN